MSFAELGKLLAKEKSKLDAASQPKNFVSTGLPQLNDIVSGSPILGLPVGRLIEIAGGTSSGKTMLASRIMIACQKQGGFPMFYDHEGSYDSRLSVIQGLDADPSVFFYQDCADKTVWSFEQTLDHAMDYAKKARAMGVSMDLPIVQVFDSFADMTPQAKGEKRLVDRTMKDNVSLAMAAAMCLPEYTKACRQYNVLGVFINQLAQTLDMYGAKYKSKGGDTLPFQCSIRIMVSGKDIGKKGEVTEKEMSFYTIKNKTHSAFKLCSAPFLFKDMYSDYDVLGSYVDYLKDVGMFEVSGAWIKFKGETFQGTDKLKDYYKANGGVEELVKLHVEYKRKEGTLVE